MCNKVQNNLLFIVNNISCHHISFLIYILKIISKIQNFNKVAKNKHLNCNFIFNYLIYLFILMGIYLKYYKCREKKQSLNSNRLQIYFSQFYCIYISTNYFEWLCLCLEIISERCFC